MISRIGFLDLWVGIEVCLMVVIGSYVDVILDEVFLMLMVKVFFFVYCRVKVVLVDIDDIYDCCIGLEVVVYFVESDKVDDFVVLLFVWFGDVSFVGLVNVIFGNGVVVIICGFCSFNFRLIVCNDVVFDF